MASDGSSRGRRKCVCPRNRKRSTPDDQAACPNIVYISGAAAFRLHPGLDRGTEAWRLAYNDRTCTDRSHTRKRNGFGQLANRKFTLPGRVNVWGPKGYVAKTPCRRSGYVTKTSRRSRMRW